MNEYKNILLNRLHTTITEKNQIYDDSIKLLSYDISIEPKIIQLEKKNNIIIICTVYFYVKAPLFDDVFFESCSIIARNEYKAIELASDNFVSCALQGILDFLSGAYHHEIETYITNNKKIFTIYESPIVCIGKISNEEDFYDEYISFDNNSGFGYNSFLWNAIKRDINFILGNNRASFIKTYVSKMPNGDILTECTINNKVNNILENCIRNEIIKWDNEGEFFSIKQFFFILQSDSTYIKYPYTKEEIEYFVIEYVLEFEKHDDYESFIKSINNIIKDNNLIEEIINFIPHMCTEYAFKDIIFNDRVKVSIEKNNYEIFKSQFTSYKYIEDALIDGFSNNIFKKETFNNLVNISSSYYQIYEILQNKPNINMKDIFITASFNFSNNYKLI